MHGLSSDLLRPRILGNPYDAGNDKTYSMDSLPQEFPSLGTGDYRTPACIIKNTDRTYCSDFRYASHSIRDGKYALKGLPAVYATTVKRRRWKSCSRTA